MTVDQVKKDLSVVAENARDLSSTLSALGDSVTVAQTAVGGGPITCQINY